MGTEAPVEKAKTRRAFWPFAAVALVLVELFVYRPIALELFKSWVLDANVVTSGAMRDTILAGDYVLNDKLAYHFRDPRRGEIVTFTYPFRDVTRAEMFRHLLTDRYGDDGGNGLLILIKRVVGVPGDTLQLKDGVLHRNGEAVDEPYVKADAGDDWGPYTVPPESYFVMGDNRHDSADSRFIGPVPRKYIRGRATAVYLSIAPARYRRPAP